MLSPTRTASSTASTSDARGAVLSFVGLRRAIGAIGMALPFVLALGNLVLFEHRLRDSVSIYYYTGMRDVLVGSLCAVGVFLFCYRYEQADDRLGNLAGVTAVGVALFPAPPQDGPVTHTQTVVGYVHLSCAAAFFACLATFCLVLFTRDDGRPTPRKAMRNTVYRVCGVVIIACIVASVLNGLFVPAEVSRAWYVLFWLESAAIVAFGVAWFVKGDTVLRDRPSSTA